MLDIDNLIWEIEEGKKELRMKLLSESLSTDQGRNAYFHLKGYVAALERVLKRVQEKDDNLSEVGIS